jgi:hypothetical protein
MQIKISRASIILFLASFGGFASLPIRASITFKEGIEGWMSGWPLLLILLASFMSFLGMKGVKQDEELVRSADRIR